MTTETEPVRTIGARRNPRATSPERSTIKSPPASPSDVLTPLKTPQQAAEYLAVTVDTLAYWRTVGRGPRFLKFNRARQGIVRYRQADLDQFINACIQESTSAGA